MALEDAQETGSQKRTITGRHEEDFYLSGEQLASFLRELASQVEDSNDLQLSTDEWELPFHFVDPVEVEVELSHDELEIEIEFDRGQSSDNLSAS